ncbi:MAG TPA: hypothetical protein VMO00_02635 [Methylomirabilota bacterium]|jgi:hypothetical protein|nr:hypothetical protein [Methylomirabilota bacterium]
MALTRAKTAGTITRHTSAGAEMKEKILRFVRGVRWMLALSLDTRGITPSRRRMERMTKDVAWPHRVKSLT